MPRHKRNTHASKMKDEPKVLPNAVPEEDKNELIVAIEKGDLKEVKKLLSASDFFEYSYKDKEGNTPLHYVGKIKDEKVRNDIATALINAGMDLKLRNDQGEKPEYYKDFKKIKEKSKSRLMSDFADLVLIKPRVQTRKLLTVLALQLVILLVAPAYALTFAFIWIGQLFFGAIMAARDKKILQKRQQQQLEADFTRAIHDNKLDSVKLVKYIEQGVNIHRLNRIGSSALEEAVYSNNLDQVNFLIPYSHKDIRRAFYFSTYFNVLDPVFERLSEFADEFDLQVALLVATCREQPKKVQFLLEKGAKVLSVHVKEAAEMKNAEIIKLIESAQKSAVAPAKDAKSESVGKVAKVVTPLFASKQKAAVKTKPKVTKLEKDAATDRKRILRSHTGK